MLFVGSWLFIFYVFPILYLYCFVYCFTVVSVVCSSRKEWFADYCEGKLKINQSINRCSVHVASCSSAEGGFCQALELKFIINQSIKQSCMSV